MIDPSQIPEAPKAISHITNVTHIDPPLLVRHLLRPVDRAAADMSYSSGSSEYEGAMDDSIDAESFRGLNIGGSNRHRTTHGVRELSLATHT